jgi:hypothetical protein
MRGVFIVSQKGLPDVLHIVSSDGTQLIPPFRLECDGTRYRANAIAAANLLLSHQDPDPAVA